MGVGGRGGMLLCQPPYTHAHTYTHTQSPTACLSPMALSALLSGSWLDGDVERKVCLCILPALGQRAHTHVHAYTHTDTHTLAHEGTLTQSGVRTHKWGCRYTHIM